MDEAPERKLTLFSVLPAAAVLNAFDNGSIAEPPTREEVLALWRSTSAAYSKAGPGSRSILEPKDAPIFSDVPASQIETTLAKARAYPPYETHETAIGWVELSKLVTPQIIVNPVRAGMDPRLEKTASPEELFAVMFNSPPSDRPIHRSIVQRTQTGGTAQFVSTNEDIRPHSPVFREISIYDRDPAGEPLPAICLPVGPGFSFASALAIGLQPGKFRLVVSNGIHRLYSIAKAGFTHAPILICPVTSVELPEPFVQISKAILLDPNQNPPVITDFLDKSLTMELGFRPSRTTVRISWTIERFDSVIG